MVNKERVRERWEREPAGTRGVSCDDRREFFERMLEEREEMHPYLESFAGFGELTDEDLLEVGVGPGNDFQRWLEAGVDATGIDIAETAIDLTRERIELFDLGDTSYSLSRADAENLPFEDDTFDVMYSFGVLHHTPDMRAALEETHRVLRPGGELRAMIYAVPSWTGLLLWVRHGLLEGCPSRTQRDLIYEKLESKGTKSFYDDELQVLLSDTGFTVREMNRVLAPGDLLLNEIPERYDSSVYRLLWRLYPTRLVKRFGDRWGLFNLVRAENG